MNTEETETENGTETENSAEETQNDFSEIIARVQELTETTNAILAKVTSLRESMDEFALAGAIVTSESEEEPEDENESDELPDDMSDLDFVIRDED